MVSLYAAIKSIGKRSSKEFSGPVTLGGVANAQITSSHGTYQVKLPLFNGNDAVLGVYVWTGSQGSFLNIRQGSGRS